MISMQNLEGTSMVCSAQFQMQQVSFFVKATACFALHFLGALVILLHDLQVMSCAQHAPLCCFALLCRCAALQSLQGQHAQPNYACAQGAGRSESSAASDATSAHAGTHVHGDATRRLNARLPHSEPVA